MTLFVFVALIVVALVEIVALFAFRAWELRAGRVEYPSEERKIFDIEEGSRKILKFEGEAANVVYAHCHVFAKKAGQYFERFLKRYQIVEKLPSLRDLLKGRRHIIQSNNPSAFWGVLHNRKEQLKDEEK